MLPRGVAINDPTRFTEAFPNLRTGSPCRDRIGLLNVLLAEGINLGPRCFSGAARRPRPSCSRLRSSTRTTSTISTTRRSRR